MELHWRLRAKHEVNFAARVLDGLFTSVIAADDATQLDALRKQIAGVWKHEYRHLGVQADTLKKYRADGSDSTSSQIRMLGKKSTVDYEGTWEILPSRILRLKVTKTSNRLFVPVDAVYEMKELKIEDNVMTYQHDGKENREVRQEESS